MAMRYLFADEFIHVLEVEYVIHLDNGAELNIVHTATNFQQGMFIKNMSALFEAFLDHYLRQITS